MSAPFRVGERVFSINLHHHAGCHGVVTGWEECRDYEMFHDGYIVSVDLNAGGLVSHCVFDPSDLISLETPLAGHEARMLALLRQKEGL